MLQIKNVSFTYSGETGQTGGVRDITLTIPQGQFVVLCGESGCGKTTLTRLLNGLIPHFYEGTLTGRVELDGQNISAQPLYETAARVGSVFQNPRSQFFNVDTTSEITFGPENLGRPEGAIRAGLARVTKARGNPRSCAVCAGWRTAARHAADTKRPPEPLLSRHAGREPPALHRKRGGRGAHQHGGGKRTACR